MKYVLFSLFFLSASVMAQPSALDAVRERVNKRATAFPQEKVYVHTDNTCYFVGDTIWYAAYTRRTDKDTPSNISRVLYVELLTSDGYLAERQIIEMTDGRGHGCFPLPDSYHGGFYELRAYTRWQLNWGRTEHPHMKEAEDWFLNKDFAKDYYRDYEKLYSRVLPVYDKPKEAGEFYHDMTGRPLRRYFSNGAPEPAPTLTLFPEGGHLVGGTKCYVAFEAVKEDGEQLEGTVTVTDGNGTTVATATTVNRGRGLLAFTPQVDVSYTATFTSSDGKLHAKASLPKVEADGVALHVERQADGWQIETKAVGAVADRELAVAVLHEGKVTYYEEIKDKRLEIKDASVSGGVCQAVVFDADGRLYADRLFFVTTPELTTPTLTIGGMKPQYEPFEAIELEVSPLNAKPSPLNCAISLSVHDATHADRLYDNGNIMTEMLLASEVRGFIPDPAWFFEADDEEHRTALDLLMLTQGWRRFDWQQLSSTEPFTPSEPFENPTQIVRGEVYAQAGNDQQNELDDFDLGMLGKDITPFHMEQLILSDRTDKVFIADTVDERYNGRLWNEICEVLLGQLDAKAHDFPAGSYRMKGDIARSRTLIKRIGKKPLVLHAECVQPGSPAIVADIKAPAGKAVFRLPDFGGQCILFLSVADSAKCSGKTLYQWILPNENELTDYYLRIQWPYPRFTQPYNYYQQRLMPYRAGNFEHGNLNGDTELREVAVSARHGGLRGFDASAPALKLDAYEVFNQAVDAGLTAGRYIGRTHFFNSVARLVASDMNAHQSYLLEPRYDKRNTSFNFTPVTIDRYNHLENLDSVFIYTDYGPRHTDDPRFSEDNIGRITVDLRLMEEGTARLTYRDRRLILPGFSVPDEFYHPDYSRRQPSTTDRESYRRTLYWNPDLQLDNEGKASIRFYNNGHQTRIAVTADGMTTDGKLLTGSNSR